MYFRTDPPSPTTLIPGPDAAASWREGKMMRGLAVSAGLARAAEQAMAEDAGGHGLLPARWTVELCRTVWMRPIDVTAKAVRSGRRLSIVDVVATQESRTVAMGRALFLAGTRVPDGAVWAPSPDLPLPPPGLSPATRDLRLYYGDRAGWTQQMVPDASAPQALWVSPTATVEGEAPSAFQLAASVADLANVVTQVGSAGLEHINADISLHLVRPCRLDGLGLLARERITAGSLATGTALLYDADGAVGTASVSTLSLDGMSMDPAERDRARRE